MIEVRSYDARIVWRYSSHGDEPYPGKIRAMAAMVAEHCEFACYQWRRYYSAPLLAELITASVARFVPVRDIPRGEDELPTVPAVRRSGWVPRRICERLTSRRPTGPPCPRPLLSATGSARVIMP